MITAIPYKPSWVVSQEPIEITVNANFTAVKPAIVMPVTKPTGTTQSDSTNGLNSDPFGYTYVGSCIGNPNVTYPPPPQQPPTCARYGFQCYYWVLQQCSLFEGPIPLLFVGWSKNAIQNGVSSIFIDYMGGGTAQSGSGLFGTLNRSGNLILVGPTITFSQSYTIETPIGSQVCIVYGPSLTFTGGSCPANNIGSPIYYVPSSGFFYIGLPGRVAYVAFQEYVNNYGYSTPLNVWANGTEPLSLLPQDFAGNYLLVYPYIDVGNGSITGMFAEVLHAYEMRRQLVVSLDDGYNSVVNVSACPSPLYGYQELTGNLAFVEYTLGNAITAYSPRPVNIAPLLESLLPGVYVGEVPTIVGHLITGAGTVSTIAGAFIDTNHLLIGANVYVNFNPSSSSSFYITLIGSPQATNPGGSSSIYPMGMIINASNYYLGLRECER
ncbi:MAG: hypothetical protein AT718_07305 [Vulcanisaeta sp. JCHS_4]|nr:MAG: hypothetical protein AT718_07305 [Vulcanisaeta sp. JCHS_4]